MGNGEFEVVSRRLRDEAKLWDQRAAAARPIVEAVEDSHLSLPAFFVGDLSTFAAGIANAALEADQYEEFRAFMEQLVQGAVTEFGQLGATLRKIADEYDRTDSLNETDLDKIYRV
ncbi:hypothetical protein ACQPYE_18575 [Actinosynnema sp. CA-299493]